ncbi:D-tagatose-bisphosphate aldolase, class II, non-catalytic subunit [Gemmobacter serpentinus]|uniref:D-tagatose-bisphosphate aldolase, class II, non-catalytic subunit n=1 Tax=Gemmobacter serpentinus TaxID=2652247 RepID=UPI00124C89C3|nr:D-tagatose-bisphosphate aldolase, class II, non-catalytic subunit [Gemmobacter serpentinus]
MGRVLLDLVRDYHAGRTWGITSVCSAHPLVLRAALRRGAASGDPVLIEATCNQVNHQGGYTGMQPADFVRMVADIALQEGCPMDQVILGGDHLGPNPWRHLPAEQAMEEACKMMQAFVAAGFRKIHLDASMGCAGEPEALDDTTTAHRAARLAQVAEDAARAGSGDMPVYIIGTEVPPPGGADHALTVIEPTAASAARQTIAVHRRIFSDAGLAAMLDRAIGVVVQPGVEFGNHNVITYAPERARDLVAVLADEPGLIFEAHSTDYQGTPPLAALVLDGFAILKVGPELTFVLREALYALDLIASDLVPGYGQRPLWQAMEDLMLAEPGHWLRHYPGDTAAQRLLRHYSLSDRIRYYWTHPQAETAVANLLTALRGKTLPLPLIWQHLPGAEDFADQPLEPEALLIWRVTCRLESYAAACKPFQP